MSESTNKADERFALQPDMTVSSVPSTGEASLDVGPIAEPDNQPSVGWMLLRELVETVVLSLIIFLLIRQVVQNYRIESHSMQPNFVEGQFILVNKLAYRLGEPTRGDVIVFHNPENPSEDYIKRVIGLPGDRSEIRDQQILINGQVLDEPYDRHELRPGEVMEPIVIAPNNLFVMGDNRTNSRDSRSFGQLSQDLIVGRSWLRVWPFDNFGLIKHYELEPGVPVASEP